MFVEKERLTGRGKSTKPVIRMLISRRTSGLTHFPEIPAPSVRPTWNSSFYFCRHSSGAIDQTLHASDLGNRVIHFQAMKVSLDIEKER